jgi:hypothetical protein
MSYSSRLPPTVIEHLICSEMPTRAPRTKVVLVDEYDDVATVSLVAEEGDLDKVVS